MRCASSAAAVGILQRQRADALEAVGRGGSTTPRSSRCRPGTTRTASSGSWMPPSFRPRPGYITDEVDALGVEHLHALVRVEARRVEVLVVAAAAEVVEASRRRCRARRARGR